MPKVPTPPAPPVPLRYVGDGSYLLDVPARDLSADEVHALGAADVATVAQLLASGLYARTAADVPPAQE